MLQPEMDFDGPDIRDHHGPSDTRYPPGCCELFGISNPFKKIGGAIKGAVKGIGKGLKAVGKVAHKAAPALAFIPGVGTVLAGGIGAIGGLAAGKGLGGALSGFLKGAGGGLLKSGIGKLGGLLNRGGGGGLEQQFGATGTGGGGGGGTLDSILNFLGGQGGKALGAAGLGALSLKGASDQRKSTEAFNQKLLDTQQAQIARAEGEFDRKAPLREGSQAALLQAITEQSGSEDSFSKFIRTSQGRKPGEFSTRGGGPVEEANTSAADVIAAGPAKLASKGALNIGKLSKKSSKSKKKRAA